MIKKIIYIIILSIVIICCNNNTHKNIPTSDIDVATSFIRAVLDNDFKTAEKYLFINEINKQYFENVKKQYQILDNNELQKYKNSDIIINSINNQNDSFHIVIYSNTYKADIKSKLKLVWKNGKWQVDLNYTFEKNN